MACYDRITRYFRLQQQKEHYKRIVFVKKNIDFQQIEQNTLTCVRPNHKYESARERQVKQSNLKLYNRLLSIKNKKGLLQKLEENSKRKTSKAEGFTTINHSLEEKINRENIKLVSRLSEVKPAVGSRKQWKKQFKKSRSLKRNLHRYVKNQTIDPDLFIRQTLTALSHRVPKDRKVHTSLAQTKKNQIQNMEKQEQEKQVLSGKKQKKGSKKLRQNPVRMSEKKVPIKEILLSGADERWTTASNLDLENKQYLY